MAIELSIKKVKSIDEDIVDTSTTKGRITAIVKAYGFKSQAHLARSLGLTTAAVSMWIKRDRIPVQTMIDNIPFINPNFITTGEGKVKTK